MLTFSQCIYIIISSWSRHDCFSGVPITFCVKVVPKQSCSHYTYVHNTARFMNRDGYRDPIVSMSVWVLATEYVMWVYFLHSTTCTYVRTIQCPILFPCFFLESLYLSIYFKEFFIHLLQTSIHNSRADSADMTTWLHYHPLYTGSFPDCTTCGSLPIAALAPVYFKRASCFNHFRKSATHDHLIGLRDPEVPRQPTKLHSERTQTWWVSEH